MVVVMAMMEMVVAVVVMAEYLILTVASVGSRRLRLSCLEVESTLLISQNMPRSSSR